MSSDDEFKTDITADPQSFIAGFQKAVNAATTGSEGIKNAVAGVASGFSKLLAPLAAVSAALAGGKFFQEAIGVANKFNGESMQLAKAMGMAGNQAAALNTALGDIGSDTETYVGAFQKFAKQIKTNESGLQSLGLSTRDSNGHLRDSNTLFTEALQIVGQYKPGLDQTAAAMTFFGKGVDDAMKLQKLNNQVLADAEAKNKALGLTLTTEGVEATKKYKAAMNDVGDVFTAIKTQIGQAVMPIVTRLAEWFSEIGPPAVFAFKVAIDLVATAVQAAMLVLKELWNILRALADPLFTLGSALRKLISGDLKGATDDMMGMFHSWGERFAGLGQQMVEDAARTGKEIANLWSGGTAVKAPGQGTRTMGAMGGDKNRMAGWEAELEQMKAAVERQGLIEGQFRQRSLQDNLAYWQELLQRKDLTEQERVALTRKAAEAEMATIKQTFDQRVATLQAEAAQYKSNTEERMRIALQLRGMYAEGTKEYADAQKTINEIERQATEQQRQVAASRVEAEREAQLQLLQLREQAANTELALGVLNKGQFIAQQQQWEQERYAIAQQGLQQRLQLAVQDPDRNPVEVEKLHRELEALEQQHQLRLGQLKQQAVLNSNRYLTAGIDSIGSSFESIVQRIGTSIRSLNDLFRAGLQALASAGLQVLARMGAEWIKQELAIRVFGKASAVSKVAEQSAAAGAGGVASMAAAPFPLNLGAPAFGAAMSAAAMAFAPLASAAGGYDIPGSVNPLVQAHAKEMVLPAKYADVIRNMADTGQAQQRVGPSFELRGVSAGDFFIAHRSDLVRVLDAAIRDNAWRPGK